MTYRLILKAFHPKKVYCAKVDKHGNFYMNPNKDDAHQWKTKDGAINAVIRINKLSKTNLTIELGI